MMFGQRLIKKEDALNYFNQAKEILEDLGDVEGIALIHSNIAGIYESTLQYEAALQMLKKAEELFHGLGNTFWYINVLNGIGWIHYLLQDYEKAIMYCNQVEELYSILNDQKGLAKVQRRIQVLKRKRASQSKL